MLSFSNPIEKAWILDLNEAGRYETIFFVWRSEFLNLEGANNIQWERLRCNDSDDLDVFTKRVVPGSLTVIDMDVKVKCKNLLGEDMFSFVIQYSVKT